MTITQLLANLNRAVCLHSDIQVEQTAAALLLPALKASARTEIAPRQEENPPTPGQLVIGVLTPEEAASRKVDAGDRSEWMFARASHGSRLEIYVSRSWLLYRHCWQILNDWADQPISALQSGRMCRPTFPSLRPAYDSLLNNHARTAHGFDAEEHIREMAKLGYTHVEVNGYGTTFPYEKNQPGELLYLFYTYCPALDQFVYSKLNKGIYPYDYLQANLNKLKRSAQLAEKYGLRAGILSFEPRSVPDVLLERYPMLRGARVDHPLRSFRPRYNLSTSHPVVLDHYSEMLGKIMKAAPNIDYMTIWSNDSGAGFEYTASLYVGRNGGGYEIREWKSDDEITQAAAHNIIRFMKTIRDAGRSVNSNFRCILRNEVFYAEQEHLRASLEPGLEFETSTLVSRGFDLGYQHPKYDWAKDFMFTGLFNQFAEKEREPLEAIQAKGSQAHIYFNGGAFWNLEPIKAVPYPKLLWEKLRDLRQQGVECLANITGTLPDSLAPYNINQEVARAFQNDPDQPFDDILKRAAIRWIGPESAERLVEAWMLIDEAYRSYPPPVSILSFWSTWYRILVRPFVPNFDKLSEQDRAYYEDFHLGHANNRVRVDFRREVNFDFCTPDYASKCREAITQNVLPLVEQAIELAAAGRRNEPAGSLARRVWSCHYDRFYAIQCWFRTQRNVAGWIEGVHGYMEAEDAAERRQRQALTRAIVLDEKENAADLLHHARTAETDWMIRSAVGETTFIYGENFCELLERKIALMEGREDDEPHVDPNFMWRVPGINH